MATTKAKKKYHEMDVDTFLNDDFGSDSESSSTKSFETKQPHKKKIKRENKEPNSKMSELKKVTEPKKLKMNGKTVSVKGEETSVSKNAKAGKKGKHVSSSNDPNAESPKTKKAAKQKKTIASSLEENDPEFYAFLKDQDKNLLENIADLSDSEVGSDDDDNEADSDKRNQMKSQKDMEKELLNMSSGDESDSESETGESGGVHKLPTKLEVASDEEEDDEDDAEDRGVKSNRIRISQSMVEEWSDNLSHKPSLATFKEVVSAFHAAVREAGGAGEEGTASKYRVEGGTIFNSIVRLCLVKVVPSLKTMLQLSDDADTKQLTSKSARWKKLKVCVKSYLTDLLEILSQLSEEAMVNAILKHVHKLVLFFASFPKVSKQLVKKMIRLWSTGEETTRVLAFLCINKIVRMKQDILLESTLKQMYMACVSNSKFTSPSTLPMINFMQKSLTELFVIDQTLAYQYAFVYIRQLAIHLRNAITVKKKNTCQAVYNWQYIHCLSLWVQLLCVTHPSDILNPLVYPLTQTIIGTIKLLPTARFYPLRFHCVALLNKLSMKTNTFIPTIPFLLEVFEQTDFNKRHKSISLKPFNFAVILKFSKAQLHEKAFKDGLIDQLYEHLLESFNNQAHSIGFPELIIPSVIQLKDFLKKCKIANYCKQIKQIVDKVNEQSKVIVDLRKKSNISLDNVSSVNEWERALEEKSTPLRKYYTSWRKLRDRELQHAVSNKEFISGAAVEIPSVQRKPVKKATEQEREDFSKLFENESDSEDETRFMLKEERPADKTKKRKRAGSESDEDDYSDFDDEELEQLAQSASSGDDSDGEVEMDDGIDDDEDSCEDSDGDDDEEVDVKVNGTSARKDKKGAEVKQRQVVTTEDVEGEEDVVEDFVLSDSESD